MHQLTFFPLGNADTTLITLTNKRQILIDYADMKDRDDDDDKRIELEEDLKNRIIDSELDVVVITHLDKDHTKGFSDFFWLEHAKKYQSDDRVKIKELWVPAAVILETSLDEEDARLVQAEARYRLKEGNGIRIFSCPNDLEKWLEKQDLSKDDRQESITTAGRVIPGFSLKQDDVEFFLHAPFSAHIDEEDEIDRNQCSVVLQASFQAGDTTESAIFGADAPCDAWLDIIRAAKHFKNSDRLKWDIFKISHHCSYLSLSDEKGKKVTEPEPPIEKMFAEGKDGGILISSSKPIPDEDTDQPPHQQAAEYYKKVAKGLGGQFQVTMSTPSENSPKPIEIEISEEDGALLKKGGGGAIGTTMYAEHAIAGTAPRAGKPCQ